jgi:hypothetical protein
MFKNNEFSIFKAHSEIQEAEAEPEPEKIIIELPAPSERDK